MLSRTTIFIGLHLLCLTKITQPMVIFTANMDDIKKLARRFVSEDIAEKLVNLILKANNDVKTPKISEENDKNAESLEDVSRDKTIRTRDNEKTKLKKIKSIKTKSNEPVDREKDATDGVVINVNWDGHTKDTLFEQSNKLKTNVKESKYTSGNSFNDDILGYRNYRHVDNVLKDNDGDNTDVATSGAMTTHQRYQGYPYTTQRVTEVCERTPATPTTPTTPHSTGRGAVRYQGYPYTNPHVHDAPSIDAATANRWAHLPRKPLEARNNVIYVDMPEEGSSQVTRSVPGSSQTRDPPDKKDDIDDNPVIYIDVPESGCSDVAEPTEPEAEPAYVQETIFYNPFDNRRIDQEKDVDSIRSSDSDSVGSGTPRPVRPAPGRPTPPNTLNLTSPGSSSGYGSTFTTPGLPPSMSKEAYVYRQQSPDDFPLSPIPISEFPQPPPAYTEIESPRLESPVQSPVPPVTPVPVPQVQEPPRTVVITPGTTDAAYRQRTDEPSPIGLPNPYRKVVYCHHCGLRVHTLVIRQTGTATHVVALSALCVGLFPITILVYCTDTCKNKNHYCPNCNKMIGYEVPILCQNMTFTK